MRRTERLDVAHGDQVARWWALSAGNPGTLAAASGSNTFDQSWWIVERPVAGHLVVEIHALADLVVVDSVFFWLESANRPSPAFGAGMYGKMPMAGFAHADCGITPFGNTALYGSPF